MPIIVDGKSRTGSEIQEIEHRTIDSHVLLVSGHGHDLGSIEKLVQAMGHTLEIRQVSSFEGFKESFKEYSPSIIIVELNLPEFDGLKALEYLKVNKLNVPLIVVSEEDDEETGHPAKRGGRQLPELIVRAFQLANVKLTQGVSQQELVSVTELGEMVLETENSTGTGIAVAEADSNRLLYVNKAFGGLTGFSADELLSMKTILKLVLTNDIPLFEKAMQKTVGNKTKTSNFELRIVRKDGLIAKLRIAARQFDRKHGKRIAIIARDTTGTTESMSGTVINSENGGARNYWTVVENATSFAVFDIDENGKVRSWNYEAEQFTGYSGVEIIGKECQTFLGNEEADGKIASFLEGSASTGRIELESWILHKNGQRFRAALTLTRLSDATGAPSGFSAFLRCLPEEGMSQERLREREAQLHSLTSHLQEAREEEKTLIARQLHEEFGQTLTALRMDLWILGRMISRTVSEPLGRGSLLEKISSVSEILGKAIKSARDMITELRPPVLDELGLLTAIQWQLFDFENRTGIKCHFGRVQQGLSFDSEVSTVMFRLLQESLENVMRHSRATEVFVTLSVVGTNLLLEVSDNGNEVMANMKDPASIAIIGMRERVTVLGGSLEVRSEKGKGTSLVVSIPHRSNRSS